MLAVLLEVPQTPDDWNRFAFNNQYQIALIQQAILDQFGIVLIQYILFPLNLDSPEQWLYNNQAAHTDFNGVLGLQSSNLQDLDFTDQNQVASWVNLNYREMFDASAQLGVS